MAKMHGRILLICFGLYFLAPTSAAAAPMLHLADFIEDENRTHFMSFDGIPPGCCFGNFYNEDGLNIAQLRRGRTESDVDAPGNNITASYDSWGSQGKNWYPSGGDFGYTRIRREGGLDFSSIGLLRGSGSSEQFFLAYALLKDGTPILSGTVPHTVHAKYLGFSGGGFDEIWLRDRATDIAGIDDNTQNALALDSIELADRVTAVPEPATMLLLGVGFGVLAARRAGATTSSSRAQSYRYQLIPPERISPVICWLNAPIQPGIRESVDTTSRAGSTIQKSDVW